MFLLKLASKKAYYLVNKECISHVLVDPEKNVAHVYIGSEDPILISLTENPTFLTEVQ